MYIVHIAFWYHISRCRYYMLASGYVQINCSALLNIKKKNNLELTGFPIAVQKVFEQLFSFPMNLSLFQSKLLYFNVMKFI